MNRYKSTILKFSESALNYCTEKEYTQEDSVVFSPKYKTRVIYIDESVHDKGLLKHNPIKLSKPFYFDDGEKYIIVNQYNYTYFDFSKILTERTNKYDEDIE